MTKDEFLKELRDNLKGLYESRINDYISFFEAEINHRIKEGKSEEEAVSELESPDEVVYGIAEKTSLIKLLKDKVWFQKFLNVSKILLSVFFPIGLPLLFIAVILVLLLCFFFWIITILTTAVELSFIGANFVFSTQFLWLLRHQTYFSITYLVGSLLTYPLAVLWMFLCIKATKLNIKWYKKVMINIKLSIIKKEKLKLF